MTKESNSRIPIAGNKAPYAWERWVKLGAEAGSILMDLRDRPRVAEWWEMAKARPSATACIPDRLDADDIAKMQLHGSKLRDAVAGKRQEYLETVPH